MVEAEWILAIPVVAYVAVRLRSRVQLSRAKHPSLRGHSRWSRRVARLIPHFEYSGETFFSSDGAPEIVVRARRDGLEHLRREIRERAPATLRISESLHDDVSDARFTSAYRVPFPYREGAPRELRLGAIVDRTDGVRIRDVDGNWRYDLSGSYGVNVFGYDFYKECIDRGTEKVRELGPVLGHCHPVLREIVERLRTVSGLDEVSFHMSGTEAVMQAVRLARYHTGRSHLVRFCGAYHGWWDGVQPGVGNQRRTDDVYTLAEMSERSLRVLETRNDIACVLVNPLQALHPNGDAPSDSTLLAGDRTAGFDREAYRQWVVSLRQVCTRRGIVLVFDEVFTGFRLGLRGAQGYFGVQADMVTYGKTLGGGLPVGVVCGRRDLMKRYRDDAPADVCFARGTFHSHPYVLGAMHEFLVRLESPEILRSYENLDAVWDGRAARLNLRLAQSALPVRVANLQSVFTVVYGAPSRYNWMLQFYLRAEGLEVAWIGTGRLIFSLSYTDDDFREVTERFVRAARRMNDDQWWWHPPGITNRTIRRLMLRDVLRAVLRGRRDTTSWPALGRAEHVEEVP